MNTARPVLGMTTDRDRAQSGQWHPEESLDDLRLFTAVVAAARLYRAVR